MPVQYKLNNNFDNLLNQQEINLDEANSEKWNQIFN